MEKKTIGAFIAALRKANGMTQKDLAEQLHVSDKTVSRWERDDGTPDLATIPVIAEIFGITCDELLRGERRSYAQRMETAPEPDLSPKAEKQLQRLLKTSFSKYQTKTCIAIGISVVGLIVALICNFAFLEAILGFLTGTIFFAGSVVCQSIFINQAFLSVEDAEVDTFALSRYKRNVISLAEKSMGVTVCFIGFSFPLVLVDAYMGLGADSLLIWGAIGVALFLLFYGIALYFVNDALIKKEICPLTEEEAPTYHHNRHLKKNCAIGLVITLLATFFFHALGSEMIWSADQLALSKSLIFNDYESFIAYMEQDIPYDSTVSYSDSFFITAVETPTSPLNPGEEDSNTIWYDEHGNEITEEEALTRTLEDNSGNVVCTYLERNRNVAYIHYSPKEGTVLPIHVATIDAFRSASNLADTINIAYCILYPIEVLATIWIYFRKKAPIR